MHVDPQGERAAVLVAELGGDATRRLEGQLAEARDGAAVRWRVVDRAVAMLRTSGQVDTPTVVDEGFVDRSEPLKLPAGRRAEAAAELWESPQSSRPPLLRFTRRRRPPATREDESDAADRDRGRYQGLPAAA